MKNFGKKLKNNGLQPASYQLVPLLKLLDNKFDSLLIADGVGVGKTIEAGYILSYFGNSLLRPSLVVCPPGLVEKWLFELHSKFSLKVIPIRDTDSLPAAISEYRMHYSKRPPVYVMASSILALNKPLDFQDIGVLVFDEIHNYRNRETKSHKSAMKLSALAKYRVGLSATPINNSLSDLVSEINLLLPNQDFDVLEYVINDLWNSDKTSIGISLISRFTKEKLKIHFADRIIEEYRVSYPKPYYDFVQSILENLSTNIFEKITYSRMAASSPKAFFSVFKKYDAPKFTDPKLEIAINIVNNAPSSHIIIFCEFEDTAEYLGNEMRNRETFILTGKTPLVERVSIINGFHNSDKAMLIMTPVGSEGLDFQFADMIINYDLHWNPMKIEQRIGRIDRIGQKKEKIFIINFVVNGSIDERILQVLKRKLKIISKSVFETSQIIAPTKQEQGNLVTKDIIEKETQDYRQFVSVSKWVNKLPEGDYKVLPTINTQFCSSHSIDKAGKLRLEANSFFKKPSDGRDWLINLRRASDSISKSINFYA